MLYMASGYDSNSLTEGQKGEANYTVYYRNRVLAERINDMIMALVVPAIMSYGMLSQFITGTDILP